VSLDTTPICYALIPSDIVSAIFSVAAALGVIYVVCFAVIAVLVTLRGGTIGDQFRFLAQLSKESHYRSRYRRESRNRAYHAWKKSKGLK
jgi:hypothetical protein